jgi:hypothetical protein
MAVDMSFFVPSILFIGPLKQSGERTGVKPIMTKRRVDDAVGKPKVE